MQICTKVNKEMILTLSCDHATSMTPLSYQHSNVIQWLSIKRETRANNDTHFSWFRLVGGSRNSSGHRFDLRSCGQVLCHLKIKHEYCKASANYYKLLHLRRVFLLLN